MTERPARQIDVGTMVRGFGRAFRRFQDAARGQDAADAYLPLFEALAWVASLDERLGYPDVPELRGLRFVRHRVHHQFADALVLTEGATFPMTFPVVFFEWRWRSDLPAGRASRDEPAFHEHLAGYPARVTLGLVWGYLGSHRDQ